MEAAGHIASHAQSFSGGIDESGQVGGVALRRRGEPGRYTPWLAGCR
ncbi:hypothetical protein STRIP9103_04167 [Streptomyces ipomoeae 91-03]|uniref:Uncharacterized protein n=1 Tax=Streptomyces ipomoeae 91-03 TaxID=698759 RepID=L1KJ47_9ACTN|nr:hypothetical protein STRIP9103_04167 [Streptomyces ipomoeae 91-03]